MDDTTGPSVEDQEVEIAALTFECRLAVEAAVLRTKQIEQLPASPKLKAELERIVQIMEQMAEAFEELHGAINRLLSPGGHFPQAELPAASHREIEEIGAAILLRANKSKGACIAESDLAHSLAKEHQVVRDAAIWLEGRGLVERVGNLGIRPHTFSRTDLRDLSEIREVFEPIACGLAAAAMSDEEIACLRSMIKPRGSSAMANHLQSDFHVQIILGSNNAALIELLCDHLHYKLRFYRDSFRLSPEWQGHAVTERERIVEALAARDASRAAAAMRRHLVTTWACTVWTGQDAETCKIEDLDAYRRKRRMPSR